MSRALCLTGTAITDALALAAAAAAAAESDITIGSDVCAAADLGAHIARSADPEATLITRRYCDLYLTGEGGSALTDAQWSAVQPAIAAELEAIVEEERVGALAYDREEREVASVEPLRITTAARRAA